MGPLRCLLLAITELRVLEVRTSSTCHTRICVVRASNVHPVKLTRQRPSVLMTRAALSSGSAFVKQGRVVKDAEGRAAA